MLQNESSTTKHPKFTRTIKSFVRREGRLTEGQRSALDRLWSRYVLADDEQLVVPEGYESVTLEIGFGNGASLAEQARLNPETFFVGIEVYRSGVGHLLQLIEQNALENIRIYCTDAVPVIENNITPHSIHTLQLFFPDPWPKKRHHKRRLVQPTFLMMLKRILKPQGIFHFATDWQPYAEHVEEVFAGNENFTSMDSEPYQAARPKTKFERRGERLGHGVYDLVYAS